MPTISRLSQITYSFVILNMIVGHGEFSPFNLKITVHKMTGHNSPPWTMNWDLTTSRRIWFLEVRFTWTFRKLIGCWQGYPRVLDKVIREDGKADVEVFSLELQKESDFFPIDLSFWDRDTEPRIATSGEEICKEREKKK